MTLQHERRCRVPAPSGNHTPDAIQVTLSHLSTAVMQCNELSRTRPVRQEFKDQLILECTQGVSILGAGYMTFIVLP
jgi:hypothetical protein